MEEDSVVEILQRYRRDRQILLGFVLCGSLIKKVIMPPGAVTLDDVDLDQVSVDYVLNCAKNGATLELSEAIRDYHDNTDFPQMNNTGTIDEFFLVTELEASGSPPRRKPPSFSLPMSAPILAKSPTVSLASVSRSESFGSTRVGELSVESSKVEELTVDDIDDFEDDSEEVDSIRVSRRNPNDAAEIVLKLPLFSTGVTDDDLRETAYEVLLACAGASGGLIVPSKDKKKERKSRLMRKLGRSKSENITTQTPRAAGLIGLLETMRMQLEISEAMDNRTRHGLLNALVGKVGKRMDALLIPLELLCCISRSEFSDKKAYIRWQKRQLKMLEEGLVNYPVVGFGESGRRASEVRILLAKIEEAEFLPSSAGELQRTECLRSLREIAIPLAERPARGDLTGEICHWADGYHLNVKLYEKLLLSVFDMLDEGKLAEESEEILELLKSTWRVLGITETIHCTCYAWLLFRQYISTSEQGMLKIAIQQLNKIPLREQRGQQERLHLKSLCSKVEGEEVSFLQSFLSPIKKWADKRLGDYHLHFEEGSLLMEDILLAAVLARRLLLEESEIAMQSVSESEQDQIELYISMSIKNAFSRILHSVENSDTMHRHPLAILAEETDKLLRKDSTIFAPILSPRHPQGAIVSVLLLHKLYGLKLKPFLDGAEHLTEDVASVFPAADNLEQHMISVIFSVCGEGVADVYTKKLSQYQIASISGTLVMRWLNSQLGRILGWIERAIQQERWEPISPQQRHGSSIVEVYRIVEETVDQFYQLKVPMRPAELNSLFRGIDNSFQVYANNITGTLAAKEDLIPPVPILTRYRKEVKLKAFMKKDLFDCKQVDERSSAEVGQMSTSALCVQLNSLHYAVSQLNKLEDSIREQWTNKTSLENPTKRTVAENHKGLGQNETFNGCRKDINAAIDRICEYTGTKIIFWDLREPFIENLYKSSVSLSRLETMIEPLDVELNKLCDIVVEPLRDRIVTSLLQASLDGILRVILDGGPSRLFFPSDAKLLGEDLDFLKEFFISEGDGLPRGVVENQVARVRDVIKLHGYETRELIEELKLVSGSGGKGKLGSNANTLLRILCHRGDSESSQFLKKQFKIPKSSA